MGTMYPFHPRSTPSRSLQAPVCGHFCFQGVDLRVAAYIDGFNLYHAIDDAGAQHLKWLNLRTLVETYAPASHFDLGKVYYFSAYATWRPAAYKRHRSYIRALEESGVTSILGQFKEKHRGCRSCGSRWKAHEEKETDVNIALHMLDGAYRDEYDRALLISGDSDLAPPIKMILNRFPKKEVRVITPFGRPHSMGVVNSAGGIKTAKKMKKVHLEKSLLPAEILDTAGNILVRRPIEYEPPSP